MIGLYKKCSRNVSNCNKGIITKSIGIYRCGHTTDSHCCKLIHSSQEQAEDNSNHSYHCVSGGEALQTEETGVRQDDMTTAQGTQCADR